MIQMRPWATAAAVVGVTLSVCTTGTSATDPRWNNIWTYYNYKNGPGPFVELNIRTWLRHNPGMKLHLVNDSNVKEYVPDMPDEFFRMPYEACKSDIIRAAAIYHHGGLYMDTDFVITKSLEGVLDNLNDHDIVSYGDHGATEDTKCGSQYSSNWHAGVKGNAFSKAWWENIKWLMRRECAAGEFVGSVEKVCCHEAGAPEKETNECHIPWAQLEHLKVPHVWAVNDNRQDDAPPPSMWPEGDAAPKLYCLHGAHSLTPHLHGEIFWQPWDARAGKTKGDLAWPIPNKKFECEEVSGGHLDCTYPQKKRFDNFFGRPGYHLFFSTFHSNKVTTAKEVLHKPWLLSEVYRRSLGLLLKSKAKKGDK